MKAGTNPIDVTGFADRTGNPAANVDLAKRRATAVRDALVAEGIPADRVRLKQPRDVTGPGSEARSPARRALRGPVGEQPNVLPLLHRAADLRRGRRDHHLPRRPRRDVRAAGAAVPDDHAGPDHGVGHLPRRGFEDAGRLRRLADRGADQRRRQHALHVVDELRHRPAHADRLLLARHQSRHRAGAGAEPRQPRAAAAADGGDAARRLRAEEIVVDHDADRRVRKGRPLQRRLRRQLRERLRARRAEARARRRPGADHGRAGPGDADLDESGPHGLARHHDERHRQRDQGAERAVRRRADRAAADRGAGRAHVPGRHAGAVHRSAPVRADHPAREPGRQRHRPPRRRRARRGRPEAVHRRRASSTARRRRSSPSTCSRARTASRCRRPCARRWRR